ncbi:DUF4232 domain-containing protein [Nocardioides sp.]|uniref:DUF4232 domain-containing protein n=1 Tax=Nocardioides sp. TaxID=35761 RepID=UPI00271ED043|nr:DUF4232 domain-containing protein [Nocardioides sp.]MDO9456320.1 DUF4232 domain-containing protein [Nocardioides sp.]
MNLKAKIATTTAALALAASGAVVGTAGVAHAQPPECANRDLTASYRATDAGAGHRYGVIRLTVTSDRTCFVRGYGGLSYVGHGNGTQVGASAERDGGRVRTVVLDPGDSVASRVDEVVAGNYPRRACRPTAVDGFRVYVPDSTVSQFVPHRTTGCAKAGVHLIGHRPFHRAG